MPLACGHWTTLVRVICSYRLKRSSERKKAASVRGKNMILTILDNSKDSTFYNSF